MSIDPAWLSPDRFAQYERAAEGDPDLASRLYEWNAQAASALFEIIHHFEVLLRNAIVRQLAAGGRSPATIPGSPWVQGAKQIEEIESRLKRRGKAVTAGRVYSGLSFGFWQTMFGTHYEELWRHLFKNVFRHSRADRPVIAAYLESLNQLRNRIAHHGSLIELDVAVEAQKIFRLVGWIDTDAAAWIKGIERVTEISCQRPIVPSRNVVIVPAADAWNLYNNLHQNAYVFQAGRSIRIVDYLAFYADQEIKQAVPRILRWYDAVAGILRTQPDSRNQPSLSMRNSGELSRCPRATAGTVASIRYSFFRDPRTVKRFICPVPSITLSVDEVAHSPEDIGITHSGRL